MAFNPSAGYNLVSSNDEASQFMGSLSGANRRGQSAMASAALRAQNYINTAEKRAELTTEGGLDVISKVILLVQPSILRWISNSGRK